MDARPPRSTRPKNGPHALIPCCHGTVYADSRDGLRATVDSSNAILDRLRRIDGVTVASIQGRWADLRFNAIRLPDVTSVLVPTTSWRARAAHRGRLW